MPIEYENRLKPTTYQPPQQSNSLPYLNRYAGGGSGGTDWATAGNRDQRRNDNFHMALSSTSLNQNNSNMINKNGNKKAVNGTAAVEYRVPMPAHVVYSRMPSPSPTRNPQPNYNKNSNNNANFYQQQQHHPYTRDEKNNNGKRTVPEGYRKRHRTTTRPEKRNWWELLKLVLYVAAMAFLIVLLLFILISIFLSFFDQERKMRRTLFHHSFSSDGSSVDVT